MEYTELLLGALSPQAVRRPVRSVLDAVETDKAGKKLTARVAKAGKLDYGDFDEKLDALYVAAAIQQWAEDDDLGADETPSDRLFALLVGLVDEDKNGEMSDDEQAMFDDLVDVAAQYLTYLGVDEDDIDALLSDWDDTVAERVRDAVLENLPDGDAAIEDINTFVFGGKFDDGEVLDAATFKPVIAVRDGKKTIIKRRIGGKVRLSSAQLAALKAGRLKAHSAEAKRKRAKSMQVRRTLRLS